MILIIQLELLILLNVCKHQTSKAVETISLKAFEAVLVLSRVS